MNDYKWKILSDLKLSHRSLIDYANLINKLYSPQTKFSNKKEFTYIIKKKYFGLPVIINYKNKYFNYNESKDKKIFFKIEKKEIAKDIFETNNLNYIGINLFFKNNKFSELATPKKKYLKTIKSINSFNNLTIKNIKGLKKNKKTIASFQTRNIPHYGHQKIVDYLLTYSDVVVINPILGPKKKGDVKNPRGGVRNVIPKKGNYSIK